MYARLVTGSVDPDKADEAVQLWQEGHRVIRAETGGFRGARLMVDRATGKSASMGLWETEAHLEGTMEWNQANIAPFSSMFTSEPSWRALRWPSRSCQALPSEGQ
jgi:quinol monooxygenase YgiN